MGSITPSAPSIDSILSTLTVEEKISLLAGKNFWETVDIPGKGVPSLKTSDGPNGARGNAFKDGTTAACFPASVLLASTWDLGLARRIGQALAEEAMSKGARVLLGPTICPHRHPLGGRNFESFSEDPFLAGKLAAQYILGLQENGVGATVKHYAANEQETNRFTTNATVSQRALREIYLKPFEIAIKEGQPWAVMTSYNLLNGTHADMSEYLLTQVLRSDWGWKGLVMSDWGGTNSTVESINAGLDLEMPGPAKFRAIKLVKEAITSGQISEETLNERCRNVLDLLVKTESFTNPMPSQEQAINRPEHRALIREVGGSGMVLLKNENNVLPINKASLTGKRVAVLGFGQEALIHGGGSASVSCHYKVTHGEGLSAALGADVELVYSKGAHTWRTLPAISNGVIDDQGQPGWTLRGYESFDFSGSPVEVKNVPNGSWCPVLEVSATNTAIVTGTYKPTQSGSHYLGFSGIGPSQLFINDELAFEQAGNCPDPMAFLLGTATEETFQYRFEAGTSYRIQIKSIRSNSKTELGLVDNLIGYHFGYMPESEVEEDLLQSAVDVAKDSALAIVFVGHTTEWEGEGQDQQVFNLPANGSQDRLVAAVSKANPNVVVVNATGTPVAMPWIDQVPAVVQSWFPGQEAGNSIADVLTGVVNPSGRLPVSFPRTIEDAPAYGNFPGIVENGIREVTYAEGIYMGYRYYDQNPSKVLFPFGHGLSYTTFDISNVTVQVGAHGTFEVTAKVANTGSVAGSHVVQVYAGPGDASKVDQPVKQLVGFAKVNVGAGETTEAKVQFEVKNLAYFNEQRNAWVVESGSYKVFVGSSSAAIAETATLTVADEISYAP